MLDTETGAHIGHCEVYVLEESARPGRIFAGDPHQRGKGTGLHIVNELIKFIFQNIDREKIALNAFNWNTGAIRCYEKAGFTINPGKTLERKIKGQTWIAVNMVPDKEAWKNNADTTTWIISCSINNPRLLNNSKIKEVARNGQPLSVFSQRIFL